jgi:hypothetical protein
MPETMRQGAHRALRQVLAAAVRWRWIDHNVATDVPNPMHARAEFDPFESWEEGSRRSPRSWIRTARW